MRGYGVGGGCIDTVYGELLLEAWQDFKGDGPSSRHYARQIHFESRCSLSRDEIA